MARIITILFRRDPSRDRQHGNILFEGYQPFWPDGRPVAVGLDAFCNQGQRLLGLGRHLAGAHERLLKMILIPLHGREDGLNRLPGHRVRRFYLERRGANGRFHFLDGTPTEAVFHLSNDEPEVLHWLGLPYMRDGEQLWLDLATAPADLPHRLADLPHLDVLPV